MPNMFAVNEMQRQSSRIQSMTREQMWRNVWCMMGWGGGDGGRGVKTLWMSPSKTRSFRSTRERGNGGGGLVFKGERNYEGAAE